MKNKIQLRQNIILCTAFRSTVRWWPGNKRKIWKIKNKKSSIEHFNFYFSTFETNCEIFFSVLNLFVFLECTAATSTKREKAGAKVKNF